MSEVHDGTGFQAGLPMAAPFVLMYDESEKGKNV